MKTTKTPVDCATLAGFAPRMSAPEYTSNPNAALALLSHPLTGKALKA